MVKVLPTLGTVLLKLFVVIFDDLSSSAAAEESIMGGFGPHLRYRPVVVGFGLCCPSDAISSYWLRVSVSGLLCRKE